MKLKKRFSVIFLILLIAVLFAAFVACENGTGEVPVVKIVISTLPKTEYYLGDAFELGEAKLTLTYENGETQTVPIDSSMISGFDSNKLGEQILTIRYGDVSEYLIVNVVTPPVYSLQVESVNHKTEYVAGEKFSAKDLQLLVTYSNGRTAVVSVDENMVSGFDSSVPGEKQLVISYGNKTCNLTVSVVPKKVMQRQLRAPEKLSYIVGDTVDFTGGTIFVSYNDNSFENLDLNALFETGDISVIVDGETSTLLTKSQRACTVTIYYDGQEFPYAITVDAIKATSAGVTRDVSDQIMGSDAFDFSQGIVTVTYNNKEVAEIPFDDERISLDTSACDITAVGKYKLGISVGGISFDYYIDVISPSPKTLVVTPLKDKIYQGEKLDVTDWKYSVYLDNGKKQILGGETESSVTEEMFIGDISDIDNFKVGKQTFRFRITATNAAELVCEVVVEILAKEIVSLDITNDGKAVYSEGDTLSLSGVALRATYNNGDRGAEIAVTESMLRDGNGNALDATALLSDAGETGKSEKTVYVCYEDATFDTSFTAGFGILLVRKASSIKLIGAPKNRYVLGEEFDLSDWQIKISYSNGTTTTVSGGNGGLLGREWNFVFVKDPNTGNETEGTGFDGVGTYNVRLSYGGDSVSLDYGCRVTNEIVSVGINARHIGFVTEGTKPDLSGLLLIVTRENGSVETIAVTDEMLSGYIAPTYVSVNTTYLSAFFEANELAAADYENGLWEEKASAYYIATANGYVGADSVSYDVMNDYYINAAEKYAATWEEVKFNFYADDNGTKVTDGYEPNKEYYLSNTSEITVSYEGKSVGVYVTVAAKRIVGLEMQNYKTEYVVSDVDWAVAQTEICVVFDNGTRLYAAGTASGNKAQIVSDGNGLYFVVNGMTYRVAVGIMNDGVFSEFGFAEFAAELQEKINTGEDKFHSRSLTVRVTDAVDGGKVYTDGFDIFCYEELISEIKIIAGEYGGSFTAYANQTLYVNEGKDLFEDGFVIGDDATRKPVKNNVYLYVRGESGSTNYYTLAEAKDISTSFVLHDYKEGVLQQSVTVSFLRKSCTAGMELRLNVISSLNVTVVTDDGKLSVIERTDINPDDLCIEVGYNDADGNPIAGVKTVDLRQAVCEGYSKDMNWTFGSDGTVMVTLRIGYGNFAEKREVPLTVKRKTLTGIVLTSMPKLEYVENPESDPSLAMTIDYTGGKVSLRFDNGTTQVLDLSDGNLSKNTNEFNPNKELTGGAQEQQTIYVSYTYYGVTKQTSYNVIIVDRRYVSVEYDSSLGYDKKLTCEYGSGEAVLPQPTIKYYEKYGDSVATALERGANNTVGKYYVQYRNARGGLSEEWPTEVGIYTVRYTYFENGGDAANNAFCDESVTLEIKKKSIAVVIEDMEFVYGEVIGGNNDDALAALGRWKMTAVSNGIADGEAYCYGDSDATVIESIKLYVYSSTGVRYVLPEATGTYGTRVLINLAAGTYTVRPEITLKENANYELSSLVTSAQAEMTVAQRKVVIAAENASKVYGEAEPEYGFRVYDYDDVVAKFGSSTDISLLKGADIMAKESEGLTPIGNKNGIYFAYDTLTYLGNGVFDTAAGVMYTDTSSLEYLLTRGNNDGENAGEVHPIYSGAAVTMPNYDIVFAGGYLDITRADLLVTGENLFRYFGTEIFAYANADGAEKGKKMLFFAANETPVVGGDTFEELFGNYFCDEKIFYYNPVSRAYASEIVGDCDGWYVLYKNVRIYSDPDCTVYAGEWAHRSFSVAGKRYEGYYTAFPFEATAGEYYVVADISDADLGNYNVGAKTVGGKRYTFTLTISPIAVSLNVKSIVISGNGGIKDQNNGVNGRLLSAYFTGEDLNVEIVDKAAFDAELDSVFKNNVLSVAYSGRNGTAVDYKLSANALYSQFTFVRGAGELNTGIHTVTATNLGSDFDINVYSEYRGTVSVPYVEHFYDVWKSKYDVLAHGGDYSVNAYIVVLPEFIKVGYGNDLSYGADGKAVFGLSEEYQRKLRAGFNLNSYYSLDGTSFNRYESADGITYSIVNKDSQYASSGTMVAGEYNGTMTYSFFDTANRNYLYLGSTMVLESSAAAHIVNYLFDKSYGSVAAGKPLVYTENFDYEVTQVGLSVAVKDYTTLYNDGDTTVEVEIVSGEVCPGDSLSLTFDVTVTYNEKTPETVSSVGLTSYSVNGGEEIASGTFSVVNAGTYVIRVTGLGDMNYRFNTDEGGEPISDEGTIKVNPIDIPIYIDYKIDDGDGNPLTITKDYQAGTNGINPIDTVWKKASSQDAFYSYGTTTCYIVKEYYASKTSSEVLQGNLAFMPSNLIVSTADADGNYPKNVKRNEDTGEIEGYPITYRIVNSDFINYSVAFVYKYGTKFVRFDEGEGYELIIRPKTALLYGFGSLNSKTYDGSPASVRSADSAITITGDYQADKIARNGLEFIFVRPESSMMIGDYRYIRDKGGKAASANITDAGTLLVNVIYTDVYGNRNYEILFANEEVIYVDENGIKHNDTAIYNILPGTVTFDFKNAVNPWLQRQYDGYGLTDRANTSFTGTVDELIVMGNQPVDSTADMLYKLVLRRYGTTVASSTEVSDGTAIGTTKYGDKGYDEGYYWYDFRGVFLPEGAAEGEYVTFESKDAGASDWLSWNYRFVVQSPVGSEVNYYGCDGIYYIAKRDVYVVVNPTDNNDGTLNVEADEENAPTPGAAQYVYSITYNGYTYKAGVTEGVAADGKYYFDIAKSINANNADGAFRYALYVYDENTSTFSNVKYITELGYQPVGDGFGFGESAGIFDANSSPMNANVNAIINANTNFNIVNTEIRFRVRPRPIDATLSLVNITTDKTEMVYGTDFGEGEGLYFAFGYAGGEYSFGGYDTNLESMENVIRYIINESQGQLSLVDDGRTCAGFPVYVPVELGSSSFVEINGVKYVKISGSFMKNLPANRYDSNNEIIERYLTYGAGLTSDSSKYTINVIGTSFRITRKEIEITGVERAYFDKDTDNYTFTVSVDDMTQDEANTVLSTENGNGNKLKDYIVDNTSRAAIVGTWTGDGNAHYYVKIPSSAFKSNDANYIVKTTVVNEQLIESEWDGISVNNGIYVFLPLTVRKAKITINYAVKEEIPYGDLFDRGEVGYVGLPTLNVFGAYSYVNHATGETITENGLFNVNGDAANIRLDDEQNNLKNGINAVLLIDALREKAACSDVKDVPYGIYLGAFVSETPIFDNFEIVWGTFTYTVVKKKVDVGMNVVEKAYSTGENVYNNYFSARWSERNDLYYADGISAADSRDRRLAYTVSIASFTVNGTEYGVLAEQIAMLLGASYDPVTGGFVYKNVGYANTFEFMSAICDYDIYVYRETDKTLAESGGAVRYIALKGLESVNFELNFKRSEIMLYPEIEGIGKYTSGGTYVNLIPDTEATKEGVTVAVSENTVSGLSMLVRYNFVGYSAEKALQYVDTKRSGDYDISAYTGMDYDRKLTVIYIPELSSVNLDANGQPSIGDVITVQLRLEESFYGGKYVTLTESNYFSVTMKKEGSSQTGYSDTILDKSSGASFARESVSGTEGFGAYLNQQAAEYALADNGGTVYYGKYDIINLRARMVPVSAGATSRKFEIILYENSFGRLVLGFASGTSYVRMNYKKYYIPAINNYKDVKDGEPMLKDALAEYCVFTLASSSETTAGSAVPQNTYYEKVGNGYVLTADGTFSSGKVYYKKTVITSELPDDISSYVNSVYVNYSECVVSDGIVDLFDGGNHSFGIYLDKVGAFTNVLYTKNHGIETPYYDPSDSGMQQIGTTWTDTTTVTADRIYSVRVSVDGTTYLYTFIGEPYDYNVKETVIDYSDEGRSDERSVSRSAYTATFFAEAGKTGINYDSLKVMLSKFTVQNRLIATATQYRYIANVVFWPAGESDEDIPYVTNEGTAKTIGEIISQIGNVTISGGDDAMDAYEAQFNEEKKVISVSEGTVDITNQAHPLSLEPGLYIITYTSKYNYGNNQEYELSKRKVRVLVTDNVSQHVTLEGTKVDPYSPQIYTDGYYFTGDMRNAMFGTSGLTYVFDSVKFTNANGSIWVYFKLTDTDYRNLTNRYDELPDVSGVALRIERKVVNDSPVTTARIVAARQLPAGDSYSNMRWLGEEKEIVFAEDSSVINILQINLERVDRDTPTGGAIEKDDNEVRLWNDTVVSFRLYQHTEANTTLVFEDYLKDGFGQDTTGAPISRAEVEGTLFKSGSAHYAGFGLVNAQIRLIDMYTDMPIKTSADFVSYSSTGTSVGGTYVGNDEQLTAGGIYMATDRYDVPIAYTGNTINIRFKASGSTGGFRYYFGMNTPYYMSDLESTNTSGLRGQRGLMLEFDAKNNVLNFFFYKYDEIFRRQSVINGLNLCDGNEHTISIFIDDSTTVSRGDSSAVPVDNYIARIFVDLYEEKDVFVPVGNNMKGIRKDDLRGSLDEENNKDLLFMKGVYYMGFEVLEGSVLEVYDCIAFMQNNIFA